MTSLAQASYACGSLRHASHWLPLSRKYDSFTIVTQSFSGHTASQTPHPQHASMLASYMPSDMTSKQESGHCSQHSVHLMHFSKSMTGRIVRVVNFLKVGFRAGRNPPDLPVAASAIAAPTGMDGMAMPSRISCHFGS